jgi:hypothetical protein
MREMGLTSKRDSQSRNEKVSTTYRDSNCSQIFSDLDVNLLTFLGHLTKYRDSNCSQIFSDLDVNLLTFLGHLSSVRQFRNCHQQCCLSNLPSYNVATVLRSLCLEDSQASQK